MPEPIRIFDGPGADHAAAKLRAAGLDVQIRENGPVGRASIRPPKIDPEIVALMEAGEQVLAPVGEFGADMPALIRCDGRWMLTISSGESGACGVSDRFAAAWLAEFDGGTK